MTKGLMAGCLMLAAACGSSPSAPSPPPPTPPPAILPAKIEVVTEQLLDFPKLDPAGWTFTGKAKNTGQGCAATVKGTARFQDSASGIVLQSVEFALDPAVRVRPAETVDWQGCCLTEANGKAATHVAVTFTWQDVAC